MCGGGSIKAFSLFNLVPYYFRGKFIAHLVIYEYIFCLFRLFCLGNNVSSVRERMLNGKGIQFVKMTRPRLVICQILVKFCEQTDK